MKIFRTTKLLVLSLAVLAILPVGALAAPLATETVSIQVNLTTPSGMKVIGTVIAHRNLGDPVNTELNFNGMINGAPASGTATAVEHWLGNGQEDIEIISVSNWKGPVDAPPPMHLHVVQNAAGLVEVNGLPVAMDGWLEAPGSGRTSYTFTVAGQGSQEIVTLPNTGAGSLLASVTLVSLPGTADGFQALFVGGLLVSASVALLCLRLVWRRWHA